MKSIYREEYKTLLTALTQARKDKGITQQELAKTLRKPQSYVSKIENGERRIDVIEFLTICRAIGADYASIMNKINS